MPKTDIRFSSFPRTEPPPGFCADVVAVFQQHEAAISTIARPKGLTSDQALAVLRDDLTQLGFEVEAGKKRGQKIERPVFFGENGKPRLRYEIDAYHSEWRCGLEVEAGRSFFGNAVYRDLVQAAVMVGIDHLCIAVPNLYKFKSGGRDAHSKDYDSACDLGAAVYGHSRLRLPYGLVVIGY